MKKLSLSLVAAVSLLAADSDLETLKSQMKAMQEQMKTMQAKIDAYEQADTAAKPETTDHAEVHDHDARPHHNHNDDNSEKSSFGSYAQSFGQSSFMPDISLIVDTSYVVRNLKDEELTHLEVPGVAHGLIGGHSHGEHSHDTYNANDGFNLNYAELGLSKSVDQWFDLNTILHISEDAIEIEEAYFKTNSMPAGFTLKGGKFKSDFGRHNNTHHHAWSFVDAPLVYHAFLGEHGINEIGAQAQWVAPTNTYLMFGVEAMQGENEVMYGNSAINPYETEEPLSGSTTQPNLIVAYAKSSADIGKTTILGGVSYANGESRIDHFADEESKHGFVGTSELYGADLTVKHYYDSYRFINWQSEWIYRDMDGTQYTDIDDDLSTQGLAVADMRKKQAGYYTQLVYGHDKNWQAGLRYDNLYKNDVIANGNDMNKPDNMDRYSVMAQYMPSEFSRIRLQYNLNKALFNEDGDQVDVKSLILQLNFAIGAHAAHDF
jgi:hypothetical protein